MAAALIIVAVVIFLLVIGLIMAVRIPREYQRCIVFRLGRLFPEPKGRGCFSGSRSSTR